MSPDGPHASSSSQSGWHSIRPWTPPLSLSVREITSVSVTFTLSSDLNGDLQPLIALGLIAAEEEADKDQVAEEDSSPTSEPKKKSIISDALAKGLSVDVNGSPWQRVFIRIEDGADEAVIIIYGLMPGREYDVKLGLVQGDSNGTIRQLVTTEEVELEPSEAPTDPESPDADHSTSSDPPPSTPSTSPNRTHPNTPPSTTTPLTIEDRFSQLQHALALINTERETLTAALKSARRDAQKADAALRSEIEILKRASEKHVAADHRAKQKLLSLQEAVKRAQTGTRETESRVKEIEELVPELERSCQEKEAEYAKVKERADRVRRERERQTEKEKKKLEAMRVELAGLTNKMEKLTTKREKLESGAITDLEEQLLSVGREIEQEEYTYQAFMNRQELSAEDVHYAGAEAINERSPAFPYVAVQRLRSQISPGTIGRPPPPTPIQRPTPSEPTPSYGHTHPLTQTPLWSHHGPRQPHAPQTHNPRSSSLQHQPTPTVLTNPHRQSSLKTTHDNRRAPPVGVVSGGGDFDMDAVEPGAGVRAWAGGERQRRDWGELRGVCDAGSHTATWWGQTKVKGRCREMYNLILECTCQWTYMLTRAVSIQVGGSVSLVLVVLLFIYVRLNNYRLTRLPNEAAAVSPVRWTPESVRQEITDGSMIWNLFDV